MISLRPMTHDDFPLLLAWLAQPHVKEWWDDGDDTLEKVAHSYGDQSPTNERFILLYHGDTHNKSDASSGQPIGYLQYEVDDQGIASIDQFIGDAAMLSRGIGTEAIKLLLAYLRQHHQIQWVTVDPAPTNARAIRCYEKVGFRYDPNLAAPGSEAAYMMKFLV